MTQTFPKTKRLLKRKEFLHVYRRGKRFSGAYFTCYLLPTQAACGRLGLSVSKKVGKAVVRNRIKRILREYFRHNEQQFEQLDVVIQVKPKAVQSLDALEEILSEHLARAFRLL